MFNFSSLTNCSVLYVGSSGSGKTSMITTQIKRTKQSRKSVFVLNDHADLARTHGFNNIGWEFKFRSLRRSTLICEDLVCLSNKELKLLATLVNIIRRHNQNTVILVTHSLRNNNIYSLVCHMNFIVFLSNRSNIGNWNVTCSIFKVPDEVKTRGQEFFSRGPAKYCSFVFNTASFEITTLSPEYSIVKEPGHSPSKNKYVSEAKLLERFQAVFKGFDHGHRFFALAQFLVFNLPPQVIAPDLSVSMLRANKKDRAKISVVDYVSTVSSPHVPVTEDIKSLHDFIRRKVSIPRLFVQNKRLM